MQRKVVGISKQLAGVISQWEGVDAVLLGETAEIGTLDPYFSISLDVYQRGNLPSASDRKSQFLNPVGFSTTFFTQEDRFLMMDLPVRIRYQDIARFDQLLQRIDDQLWAFHESGTTSFYRLQNGQVLHSKSGWLGEAQKRLARLPDHFWKVVGEESLKGVSNALSDLNPAVFRNDRLFTLLSSAAFCYSICSFLFALNKRFEPPGRRLYEKVTSLPLQPDEFKGRFESFLREDPELPAERKREIAELLAKSVTAMQ